MKNLKTLFPYFFGLVSLIISWGIVTQRPAELELPPSPTPIATAGAIPAGARWAGCRPVSRPRSFFYIPSTDEAGDRVTISGTVYASDFSPLPGALIEISQPSPDQANSAYPPPARLLIRTDKAGRYGFTVLKPPQSGGSYIHYEIIYQEGCPYLMHMHLMASLPSQAVRPLNFIRVIEATGPVLRGPVDIVMPVSPPKP